MPTRRDFLALTALAAGSALLPAPLRRRLSGRSADTAFRWESIGPSARVAYGTGGNSLVVVGRGEALLVDTKVSGFGQVLAREASAFGARIRTVINTHHHGDHTGGNDAFAGTATTVAHARAKRRVLADVGQSLASLKGAPVDAYAAGLRESGFDVVVTAEARRDVEKFIGTLDRVTPESFAPTETLETERELRAAGYVVQLTHVTPAHTDNDVIVRIPELNILHVGDLLFNRHHAFVDVRAGATTVGWDRSLAAAMAMCTPATRVVAGHGPATDLAGLQRQRDYFDRLRDAVGAAIKEGRTRAEVVALRPAAVANLGWPGQLPDTLGVVYDELTAKR
ncbi:MAG TPA: MBL fold metallo-hydrolase [Gemmatimonadaceae bacterium]|nr:MBL fold metallo-hydrolase [Gemmatimonadaceae bacterium]